MKRSLASLLFLLGLSSALAQYTIDWSKIAGGGGTSTGGVYAATATWTDGSPVEVYAVAEFWKIK